MIASSLALLQFFVNDSQGNYTFEAIGDLRNWQTMKVELFETGRIFLELASDICIQYSDFPRYHISSKMCPLNSFVPIVILDAILMSFFMILIFFPCFLVDINLKEKPKPYFPLKK